MDDFFSPFFPTIHRKLFICAQDIEENLVCKQRLEFTEINYCKEEFHDYQDFYLFNYLCTLRHSFQVLYNIESTTKNFRIINCFIAKGLLGFLHRKQNKPIIFICTVYFDC